MDLAAIQEILGHSWVVTTMNYIHVHRTHVEDAWICGQQRAAGKLNGLLEVTAGAATVTLPPGIPAHLRRKGER